MAKLMRWAAVAALVVGMLIVPATQADAYDSGKCNSFYGAGNVARTYTIQIDTGTSDRVDFGDHPHWFGAPQGTAVVCWARDGRVAVFGYVFADSEALIIAQAEVTFIRANGTESTQTFGGSGNYGHGFAANRNSGTTTTFNRVRVRLFNGPERVHTACCFTR